MRQIQSLHFVDARGRAWKVYDFSVLAGRTVYTSIGSSAAYRGFAPIDRGARRTYMFKLKDDRRPTRELLEQQLAASSLFHRDDPALYEVMKSAGLNPKPPERVDPPGLTPS